MAGHHQPTTKADDMSFHLYDISELYSNADGSIQFIELKVGGSNGESFWRGLTLQATQSGTVHSFTFPTDLPSTATANTSVLVATQGFADLGVVTPNFIVPANFLFTSGAASVDFAGVDIVRYTSLPTDGVLSIGRNLATAINSPTNFAGQSGSVSAPALHLVQGGPGPDVLVGGAGPDKLDAQDGNDRLDGGGGDDQLLGGLGVDTALFHGPRSAYTIGAGAATVTGPDGTDTPSAVERLQFDDLALAFDAQGAAGQTEKLLSAVFGAAFVHDREYIGIGLFLFDIGESYAEVAERALHARLGPSPSNAEVVALLYTHVVGSPPDAETTDQFVSLIVSGQFTQTTLTMFAADHELNLARIDLVGVATQGLEYTPFGG